MAYRVVVYVLVGILIALTFSFLYVAFVRLVMRDVVTPPRPTILPPPVTPRPSLRLPIFRTEPWEVVG